MGVEIIVGIVYGKNKNIMFRFGMFVSEGLVDDAWW